MDLGNTIKTIRKNKNIRQIDVAEKCSISLTYLSQIENNKKEPSLNLLKDISNCLGIPIPVLFFLSMREDDIPDNKMEAYRIVSPSIQNFLGEFFALEI